jgi:hypothetical protein
MPRELSEYPKDRLGVYKRLEEVPSRYRLNQHAAAYRDKDVWETFLEDHLFPQYSSDRYRQDTCRAGQLWKEHMADRGRHHALATPADVDQWCKSLLDRRNVRTVYNHYWVRLERFYSWLLARTDHPHVYQPFLMAAVEYDTAGRIWDAKVSSR